MAVGRTSPQHRCSWGALVSPLVENNTVAFHSQVSVALARTRTWLADRRGAHEADEGDVGGAAGLQGDGVHPEVLQHVKDRLEPQVLHPTLAVLVQGQTQVLQGAESRCTVNTTTTTQQ